MSTKKHPAIQLLTLALGLSLAHCSSPQTQTPKDKPISTNQQMHWRPLTIYYFDSTSLIHSDTIKVWAVIDVPRYQEVVNSNPDFIATRYDVAVGEDNHHITDVQQLSPDSVYLTFPARFLHGKTPTIQFIQHFKWHHPTHFSKDSLFTTDNPNPLYKIDSYSKPATQ